MLTNIRSFFSQGLKGDPGSPGVAGPKGEKVLIFISKLILICESALYFFNNALPYLSVVKHSCCHLSTLMIKECEY